MCQIFRNIILVLFLIEVSQCFGLIRGSEDEREKSSLVFVFDTTGSMYNDLRQLREGAEMILNTALEEGNVIGDFVFVPFHDPTVGPPTVTTDKEIFKKALDAVHVYGGGDCPEKSLTGIQLALNVSASNSYVYVFTDATAGDHRFVGKLLDAVQRKQSQIVFVLTGHCNDLDRPSYKVYQQIAAASSGQVFNLNKTSVHKVLDFVRSSIKGKMVNLGSSVNPPGHNYTQGIPVDSTLGEVTVSVSGAKPQITVVNPSGEQITGPPQLVTALDLSEIMVVKVLQPEPGNWTITVGSEEEYSVKVVGLSNLTFNHGFSVEKPTAMAETSYRPLQGTYNHMMLSLTQMDIPVDIDYAEILAMNGATLFEVPLKIVDKENKVYLADAFIPPEDFFYIAIKGRDQYNQELRRVGTTAVQAKSPDVPYLSAPMKIQAHAHSRVVLKCRVESLVPVTAMWTKDTYKIQPKTSSLQTTTIEYIIDDMKEENVGLYRCVARNVAGMSRAETDVTLLVDPPQVSIRPDNTSLDIGQNVTITCTVFSEALLTKFNFVTRTSETTNVIKVQTEPNIEGMYSFSKTLLNVNETDAGSYKCIAANRGGISNQTTHITIQSKPIVQIIPPPNLNVLQNSTVSLMCRVSNTHVIKWIAPDNSVYREVNLRDFNGSDIITNLDDVLNVNVNEDGVWKCVGLRGEFEASDSVEIKTFIKPTVTIKEEKNITVLTGTTYDVICEVMAKPQPAIQWFKGMEPLDMNITQVSTNLYRSTLKLDTSSDVSGNFTCVGFNAEGMENDTISVNIRRKLTVKQGFNDTSVLLYSQFELHCLIDSDPAPIIIWYHNETELHTERNVFLNDDNSTLYVTSVDFHNLGSYACKADNGYESVIVNGTLSVYGLEYPVIVKTPTILTVKQGESAVITCRITKSFPEPSIKWQYKNESSDHFINLRSGEIESELRLRNVSTRNAGVYRCIAENVLGNDTYDIEVVVNYAPIFKVNSENTTDAPLEIKSGDTVEFSCESIGSPLPIVTWTKDGLPLLFKDNVQALKSDVLTITNVTKYNSGVYVCNATSAMGSVTKNFTLFVYEAPKISSSIGTDDDTPIEVLEGQLVELPCKVRGVPKPKVSWLHNGDAIEHGRIVIEETGIRFIANLTDFGEFTCLATNKYGNSSANYTLYIWVPPYVKPPLESTKEVKSGDNVTLQCDVVGFPIPTVQWTFKDQMLKENTTDISFNEVGSVFLTNVSTNHEGIYACIAENIAGAADKYIYLNVNDPPKILEDNYTGPFLATNMDTALTITCKVTGKPKPFVSWITDDNINVNKDPRYTVDMDGTLTIVELSEDMSGNYTCIAENNVGKVNKTVAVEIYTLPSQLQSDETHTKVTVVEDSDADIECPIRASTADTVKWYKDAKLISTGNLRISKINRFNQTTYACVLSNAVGSAYSTVNIVVEWPPKFITDDDKKEHKGDDDKMNDKLEMLDDVENPYSGLESFDDELENVENKAEVLDVVQGDDAYLDCRVDAKPDAKIKWLYNSKPILFEDKDRLKLFDVQQSQSGVYKCIVNNVHGTILKEFNLNVLVPPFISNFDVLDVNLMEGMNATLECNAKGYPEPNTRWSFNNSNWHLEDSTLSAFNVSVKCEGIYRCDASNKAGSTHIVYRVSVVSAAKVTEVVTFTHGLGVNVENTVEAELGSHIRIACKTSGKPTPIIQWVRNGKVVGVNSPDISYADLVLDVAASHAGGYSCMASNEGGNDRRDVKLDVLEPPKIFKNLFQSTIEDVIHIEKLSGQAFFLHCHPYGNPLPEVYWFKDDLPLKLFDESMVSKEFGEIIEVKSAVEEQSGNYTCVARNKVGNTSVVYLVDVLVPPPQPKESSKKVHVRAGKQLNVTCPVQGSPTPYVMWIKHPYTEINADTPRVTLLNDNVTLLINHTHISDSGNYSCIMTNKAGTTEFIFTVSVEKPPSIGGGSDVIENHRVNMRRSIVLKCEADGHPLPKITWLKETQEISSRLSNIHLVLGNSLLAIWSVTSRDAGQYICVAENVAGVTHRRYNLAVVVPGKWSSWGQWSFCNVTCGLGHQLRSRSCQYIDDNDVTYDKTSNSDKIIVDESACKGPANEKRKCHMPPCEEERSQGSWFAWSKWSVCSSSCGLGTQARTRRCRTVCSGDNVQVRKCPNLPPCDNDRRSNNNVYNDNRLNNDDYDNGRSNNNGFDNTIPNSDAYDSNNDNKDPNEYTPEAVFEVEPKIVNPQYPTDTNDVSEPTAATNESSEYYEVNVTFNLDGSDPGPCSVGFFYDSVTGVCDDVDECLVDNNECHSTQVCTNIEGGYRCSCPSGFVSLGLGQRCMDINECTQETSGCEFACVNVAGGYVCACPGNMRLHADKHHCYTVSSLKRTFSYEDIDLDLLSTSIEYPARYKHIR